MFHPQLVTLHCTLAQPIRHFLESSGMLGVEAEAPELFVSLVRKIFSRLA